jgi:RND family efflux transporter MFP subunit
MKHLFPVVAAASVAVAGLALGVRSMNDSTAVSQLPAAPTAPDAALLVMPGAAAVVAPVTESSPTVVLTVSRSLAPASDTTALPAASSTQAAPVAAAETGSPMLRLSDLLSFPSAHAAAPPADTAATLTVQGVRATPLRIERRVAADGNIAAWQEAVVGAEVQLGRLTSVNVQIGDRVKKGDVLAVANTELVQAELAQLEAALEEAQSALADASFNADRARQVQGSGALSPVQIGQYLTAERSAKARVAAQTAAVSAQRLRVRNSTVRAPDDGIISARTATVGAVVPPGMELFRLIRQGRLEWRAEVSSNDLPSLQSRQAVTVQLPGGETLNGQVRSLSPTVDPTSRRGLVYVDLPAPGNARPGLFAQGQIQIGQGEVATLPATAVLLRDGFHWVFVIGADQKVAQTKVQVGRRSGDRIEITGGLPTGAQVVANGTGFLADGDRVRVVAASVSQ